MPLDGADRFRPIRVASAFIRGIFFDLVLLDPKWYTPRFPAERYGRSVGTGNEFYTGPRMEGWSSGQWQRAVNPSTFGSTQVRILPPPYPYKED